jgi:flagellar basal-body rod modification protein FlgD
MTVPIGANPPVQSLADLTALNGSAAPAAPDDAMGSDTFLKLLVAQLKYQDPSKPADSTALLGQTAQFQMVEKLQQLSDQNTQMISEQQASSAIALVGRSITYTVGDKTLSGVVGSVRLTAGGPMLEVGQTDVPLATVTEISSVTAPSPAAAPAATGAAATAVTPLAAPATTPEATPATSASAPTSTATGTGATT